MPSGCTHFTCHRVHRGVCHSKRLDILTVSSAMVLINQNADALTGTAKNSVEAMNT